MSLGPLTDGLKAAVPPTSPDVDCGCDVILIEVGSGVVGAGAGVVVGFDQINVTFETTVPAFLSRLLSWWLPPSASEGC